jgi:hypothetical protein
MSISGFRLRYAADLAITSITNILSELTPSMLRFEVINDKILKHGFVFENLFLRQGEILSLIDL